MDELEDLIKKYKLLQRKQEFKYLNTELEHDKQIAEIYAKFVEELTPARAEIIFEL